MVLPLLSSQPEIAGDFAIPSNEEMDFLAAHETTMTQLGESTFGEHVAFSLPGTVLAFADTLAESLVPGVEDDDLETWLADSNTAFGDYFNRHRQGLGAAGDIAGLFIPAMLGAKAVRTGGFLAKAAEKTLGPSLASVVTSTGKSNAALFEEAFQLARVAGKSKAANLDAVAAFPSIKASLLRRSLQDVVIESVAAEAFIAASMHSSEFLYPDEMTLGDNLAWFAGTTVATGFIGNLIAGRTMRKGVQEAFEAGRSSAFSPAELILADASGALTNARGPAMAATATVIGEEKSRLAEALQTGDQIGQETASSRKTASEVLLKDLTLKSFRDDPLGSYGLTSSVRFDKVESAEPYVLTTRAAMEADPTLGHGLLTLEKFESERAITLPGDFRLQADRAKLEIDNWKNEKAAIANKNMNPARKMRYMKRLDNQIAAKQADVDLMERTALVVAEIDGTTRGLTRRAGIFQDGERNIASWQNGSSATLLNDRHLVARADGRVEMVPQKKNVELEIDAEGNFTGTGVQALRNTEWAKLSHEERTGVFDVLQHAAERIDPVTWQGMKLTRNSHWTQYDFAARLYQIHGDKVLGKIAADGLKSVDDLHAYALSGKYEAFKLLRKEAVENADSIYNDFDNIARALNLPGDNHPILAMFEKIHGMSQGQGKLSTMTQNDLKTFKALLRQSQGMPVDADLSALEFVGSMMNLPRDRKPVMMMIQNLENNAGLQARDMAQAAAQTRSTIVQRLRNAAVTQDPRERADFVGVVLSTIDNLQGPVMDFKRNIMFLMNGNESGGFFNRTIAQQHFRFREQPAFEAIDMVTRETERAVDKLSELIIKGRNAEGQVVMAPDAKGVMQPAFMSKVDPNKSLNDLFNDVLAEGSSADLTSAMIGRHSIGAGWELASGRARWVAQPPTKDGAIHYKLKLKDSAKNRELWEAMFPEKPWPYLTKGVKEVFMPVTRQDSHVLVTDKGRKALEALNELDQRIYNEEAALLRAVGKTPPERRDFHIPSKNLAKKHRAYMINESGKVAFVVAEDTETALRSRIEQNIKLSKGKLRSVSEDTMRQYYDASSLGFDEMDDFSRLTNQTGPATGKAFDDVIEVNASAFQDIIEQQLRRLSDVGRKTRQLLFEPELQYARFQRDASGAMKMGDKAKRTIFDELQSRIAGTQNLDPKSAVGKVLTAAESLYDNNLKEVAAKIGMNLPKAGMAELRQEKRFEAMQAEFGSMSPFKSMQDYMERTMETPMPFALRKHAALLNEVTTALTIRMFDAGMAVVNVISMAATLPPVIAMLAKRADETDEQHLRRIGAFSGITDGGQNAYFSPAKAISDAIHFSFSDEGRRISKKALEMGYKDQLAAEAVELYGRTGEQFLAGILRRGVNAVSILTDSTERLSRSMAWMTFYNIGRKGLQLDERAAMAFAHQQANRTIADFRPANRPAIFQGAAGMPLGLFTTYMWNYSQRMVELLETASFKPFVKGQRQGLLQVVLQGTLFGAESLPGWSLYVEQFMSNYDGSSSPVDRLNDAMGYMGADVFLNGTVSNLSKFVGMGLKATTGEDFGLDDGISVGPRAAVGLPFESGLSAQNIAGLRLIQRTASTIGKSIDSVIQSGGIDPTHQAEIIAASGINKGIGNMIELFWTGRSLDHSGNIIEEDTRTTMGVASRMLGFKPLFADEMRAEDVRNRATDRVRTELKDRLAETLKSKIRNGKLRDADVEDALDSYIRAGGNAENFRRYMQSQILRGTTTKGYQEQKIAMALARSIDQDRLGRLLYLSRD